MDEKGDLIMSKTPSNNKREAFSFQIELQIITFFHLNTTRKPQNKYIIHARN